MHFSVDSQTAVRVRTGGIYLKSGPVTLRFLPDEAYRYSPVVSKKQGTSVQRNRIKRVIREIMRAGAGRYPSGSYLIYFNGVSAHFDRGEFLAAIGRLIVRIPEALDSRSPRANLAGTQGLS